MINEASFTRRNFSTTPFSNRGFMEMIPEKKEKHANINEKTHKTARTASPGINRTLN
jgi:hypothetical protein